MPTSITSSIVSSIICSSFGIVSKAFLNFGCRSVKVEGLETLLSALREPGQSNSHRERNESKESLLQSVQETAEKVVADGLADDGLSRRGIVTVCNHTSVVDDPMMWGIMPFSTFLPFASPTHTSRNTRWTLGASDIMFTNQIFSRFFTLGQVIETVRGGGIFQPAIDEAIKKLQAGEWIHIFPEGRVNQVSLHPPGGLIPFKWGISRMIMDSARMPIIIPIWISGFEDVMPDTRKYLRFLPRPGKRISITIGAPITNKIAPLVDEWRRVADSTPGQLGLGGSWSGKESIESILGSIQDAQTKVDLAATNPERKERSRGMMGGGKDESVRIKICQILTDELATMGRRIEEREGKDKRAWRNAVRRDNI